MMTEAKFLDPDWEIYCIVDYGIGFSYTGPQGYKAGGQVWQPYTVVDYIPQSGTKNLASVPSRYV
jgi:hypothetical protein